MNPNLILRTVTTPYGDITLNSVLSHSNLDNNFIGLKSNLIYTATTDNGVLSLTKINGESIDVPINGLNDIYVSAMTFNVGTYDLTLERNDGISFNQNLSILATDMTVTGGSYDINSGVVTFVNNSGGTFNVSGFVSGYTDSGISNFTYNNANTFNITDTTGGTFNASFNVLTGLTINGSLSANTITITNLNSGTPINNLGIDIDGNVIIGTISSGTTSGFTDTFITGGTYLDGITELTNNTGGTISISGFSTGYTLTSNEIVNSLGYTPLSAYTDTDTFITGGTYSAGTTELTNNTGGTISISGFFTNVDDIHTTAFTFNQGTYNLTVSNSDGNDFTQNLGILSSDMTITGGTYNPTTGVGTFVNNSGGTFDVSGFLTGLTDTYIISGASNSNTGTLTLRRSDNANITVTGFTSGTSINWYAENTALPATKPVATGAGSIAFGNLAQALGGDTFVYGNSAGTGVGGYQSNFMGWLAGNGATSAFNCNFMGSSAGQNATNANSSNFFGRYAGQNAINAFQSNFFGMNAGASATNSNGSNFMGYSAGQNATNAIRSNFIGETAGYLASNASYSNLFGYNAGRNNGNNIGSNNIIIGTNISLPSGTSNAINLGGVLFGTGTYSTISVVPSITGQTNGRIGIGIVNPLEKLHVSGNTRIEGGLILKTLTGGTSVNNLGIDIDGNLVTGNTSYWVLNNTNLSYIYSSGTVNIGTTNDVSAKLVINTNGPSDVSGKSFSIKDLNSEKAYINSSGKFVSKTTNGGFYFPDEGTGFIGNSMNNTVIFRSYAFGNLLSIDPIYSSNPTTGITNNFNQIFSIAPVSGGSQIRMINLEPTVNQTGSTPAIIHGIRIAPTLTNAFDFRAIEVTDGKVIIPRGNSSNEAVNLSQITNMSGTSISGANFTNSNSKITLPTITGSTGEIVYFGSGSGLTAGLIYYLNSSGQWILSNASTASSSKYMIGIALGSSITNGILVRGYARYSLANYSGLTTGSILYLSTTNGLFQTTSPTNSNEIVRIIGYCVDSSSGSIYFNPDNTWVEIL